MNAYDKIKQLKDERDILAIKTKDIEKQANSMEWEEQKKLFTPIIKLAKELKNSYLYYLDYCHRYEKLLWNINFDSKFWSEFQFASLQIKLGDHAIHIMMWGDIYTIHTYESNRKGELTPHYEDYHTLYIKDAIDYILAYVYTQEEIDFMRDK
jgi:hypothetical protein